LAILFGKRKVAVGESELNLRIVRKLNKIYASLWKRLYQYSGANMDRSKGQATKT
jgi:hypothetical protein